VAFTVPMLHVFAQKLKVFHNFFTDHRRQRWKSDKGFSGRTKERDSH
jgi:hypothetical protein